MPTALQTARERHAAKAKELKNLFERYPDLDMPEDVVTDIQTRNRELTDLVAQIDRLSQLDEARVSAVKAHEYYTQPAGGIAQPTGKAGAVAPQPRNIDQVLQESKAYADFRARRGGTVVFELSDAEAKTLITLTDMNAQAVRRPEIVPSAQPFRSVSDLMATGTVSGNTIEYYEETTFTNAAVEVAEGAAKPESALSFTLRTDNVRKIATWIPATDEVLSDLPQLRSYIEGRLRFMVLRRREQQLLNGDGTAPNLRGIANRSGIQTQAKGADPTFDAILKAMVKVQVTGDADPDGIVMHPNDWQDLRLTRTADGLYILGNPGDTTAMERLWGLPLRVTPAQTENTAIVGAFGSMSQVFFREGLTITVSTEHSTYFVENKVAILAEERLALACYRPAAFCTVTGI